MYCVIFRKTTKLRVTDIYARDLRNYIVRDPEAKLYHFIKDNFLFSGRFVRRRASERVHDTIVISFLENNMVKVNGIRVIFPTETIEEMKNLLKGEKEC